jgi:DNA-binding transcriptional regulator WhiA
MQQMTIELPATIINALAAYNQEHKVSSSDTVQTALESFLVAKGYLAKPKKSFHLSINHDAVLAEFTLSHKLP